LSGEYLNDPSNFSTGNWTLSGGFAVSGSTAVFTYAGPGSGSVQQAFYNMSKFVIFPNGVYQLNYNISASGFTVQGGTMTLAGATKTINLPLSAGSHSVYFTFAAAFSNVEIDVSGVTSGSFTLTGLSLKKVLGGTLKTVNAQISNNLIVTNNIISDGSTAAGTSSIAFGGDASAGGNYSFALGNGATASADNSAALGVTTLASGKASLAVGEKSTSQAYDSLVIGRNNVVSGTTGSWVTTDPLFVIGIGSDYPYSSPANALTVLKNGKVGIGTTTPSSLLDVQGNIRALGGLAGHATCWKADRKTIGYCSTVVAADGTCTCN
jgi:autotransporter adhesin